MAAVSSATTTTAAATALTPPSSSHGNGYAWNPVLHESEFPQDPSYNQTSMTTFGDGSSKSRISQNGGALINASSQTSMDRTAYGKPSVGGEPRLPNSKMSSHVTSQHGIEPTRPRLTRNSSGGFQDVGTDILSTGSGSATSDSGKKPIGAGGDLDDVSSKWIHRDKLARIESEELQAAGIILPKPRARSMQRREVSADKANGFRATGLEMESSGDSRSRKNSAGLSDRRFYDAGGPSWDLRLPEEIAEESYFVSSGGAKGVSRIPIAKQSFVPIPLDHIERDMPMARKRDSSPSTEDSILYKRTRSMSGSRRAGDGSASLAPPSPQRGAIGNTVSDVSSRKTQAGNVNGIVGASPGTLAMSVRKASATAKSPAAGRPKTRNGTSKDSNSSGTGATRPSTRSGDRDLSRELSVGSSSKQPEGDPPWIISAYRPDPRLPPDQQLLPTVARRLQQEKWEREGKFGSIYDKEFRPLTDEGFNPPPEPSGQPSAAETTARPTSTSHGEKLDEWPLKREARSPTHRPGRTGSYSTIPRIQDRPSISPLPSPMGGMVQTVPMPQDQAASTNEKGATVEKGCGCCIIM